MGKPNRMTGLFTHSTSLTALALGALTALACSSGSAERDDVAAAQSQNPTSGVEASSGAAADDGDDIAEENSPGDSSSAPTQGTSSGAGEDSSSQTAETDAEGEGAPVTEPGAEPSHDEGDGDEPAADEEAPGSPEETPLPEGDPPEQLPPDSDPGLEEGECAPEDCGEDQILISRVCPDGSASTPTCSPNEDGVCAWSVGDCPEPLPGSDDEPKEAIEDETACESDVDCTLCDIGPVEEGDCVCPSCPSYPVNADACKARQTIFQACAPVILCPQVLCTLPPTVGCVEGQCVITREAEAL